ncbi:p-loop containing nucleoside triphosphate hydrolase [Petrocella atlantisensis]|uniref:p-loop containing nucleoside triphosphate hydrolase n=1 Tax=Petrocella atlantisensis TaxID=2173034 RepID=A0A3P7PJW5_9FIRM|nr:hypothetical protein [Petrocella atlantisensis]VDN49238.1 p-loop containing nucleoside triphosphate hydrolase [Petrocella atlantisensis]
MILSSVVLREGLFHREVKMSSNVNLIHSEKNSRGKTTLLRFILYGLGYNIPNTKKIKFNHCDIEMVINTETSGEMKLLRLSDTLIEAVVKEQKHTFVLPNQLNELHSMIFGTDNPEIIKNLLGAFYVDQEKGWTLLNRGVVIGSIHFNIEELIRGLSGRDCKELIEKEARLTRELSRYRQIFSISQYQKSIEVDSGSVITDSYEEQTESAINQLLLTKKRLRKELKRIDNTLEDNKRFKNFVADMKLLVQAPDGTTFPVTEGNIVGLSDAVDLLSAKRKMVASEISIVSTQIENLYKEKNHEYEQLEFFQSASLLEVFDNRISSIPMNAVAIKREIDSREKERKKVKDEINKLTKISNTVVSSISNSVIKYLTELGLGDKETIPATYLFTSNLKELSGAVLHKTAFAFRLAYIIAIEDVLGIKLPILLDSPSGKEVDQANVKMMMDILKRDFSDHQIIIASIFNYNFDEVNTIEIKERLIEIDSI